MATETLPAARALPPTTRRRATTIVLVVGTVLSVAAAFGPVWVVRGGLVVAIAAAVTTSVLAWREVHADRRDHAAAMLAASLAHGEVLRIERSHNSAVLQVITDRYVAATAEITKQQAMISQLYGEISSLKGDRAALTAEIACRATVILELRADLRARTAELDAAVAEAATRAAALTADEEAEVHTMPRRVLLDGEDQPRRASADPWGNPKTVIDLDPNGLDRGPERQPEWAEPVLPNYEEDRRLA